MRAYISPYKIFNLSVDATESQIQEEKQRILERLKHYKPTDKVHISTAQLEKSTVLELLKDVGNYQSRQYHIAIYEDKKLLNFLEYGHLNYFRNPTDYPKIRDSAFAEFIALYFGYQYSETLLQAIKTQDEETLSLLSSDSLPMMEDFEEQCFQHANYYVGETIKELKQLQKKEELLYMSERELVSYLPNKKIELYNMLPDYFSSVRNLIGNEIYALSVVLINNYGRSDGASAMLQQGLKLKLDSSVRSNLERMLKKFSFQYQVPMFVWVALAAISFLFMLKYLETLFWNS